MSNKKQNGSYYTPQLLSDFLIKHILINYKIPEEIRLLEPSCGNGNFIESFLANIDDLSYSQIEASLVEIDPAELKKTIDIVNLYQKKILK